MTCNKCGHWKDQCTCEMEFDSPGEMAKQKGLNLSEIPCPECSGGTMLRDPEDRGWWECSYCRYTTDNIKEIIIGHGDFDESIKRIADNIEDL